MQNRLAGVVGGFMLLIEPGTPHPEERSLSSMRFDPQMVRIVSIYRAEFFFEADRPFSVGAEKPVLIPRDRVPQYAARILLEYPGLIVEACFLAQDIHGLYGPPPMKWEGPGNRKERCVQYGKPTE